MPMELKSNIHICCFKNAEGCKLPTWQTWTVSASDQEFKGHPKHNMDQTKDATRFLRKQQGWQQWTCQTHQYPCWPKNARVQRTQHGPDPNNLWDLRIWPRVQKALSIQNCINISKDKPQTQLPPQKPTKTSFLQKKSIWQKNNDKNNKNKAHQMTHNKIRISMGSPRALPIHVCL